MSQPQQPQIGKDGYWYTKWVDPDGIQRMKRFGHSEKVRPAAVARKYKNWRHDWERDPALQRPAQYKVSTIDALIDAYLVEARAYYRQVNEFAPAPAADQEPERVATGEAYNMKVALDVLRDIAGDKSPQAFTPQDLVKCQAEMIGRGLVRTTINARVNRIRRFLKWLTRNGHVRGIVADLLSVSAVQPGRGAAESKPVVAVHRGEIDAVFVHIPKVVQAMIEVEWLAGMRPGEVVVMRAGDIDRSGALWIYQPAMHKTKWRGKEKKIVLGPQAQAILDPFLLKVDPRGFIFSPREAMLDRLEKMRAERKTPVQPSQLDRAKENPRKSAGDRYTTSSYRRSIHYACDAANRGAGVSEGDLKALRWSPNQLRHACATRIKKQYGRDAARAVLGHSDSQTTEGYIDRDVDEASAVMREMG